MNLHRCDQCKQDITEDSLTRFTLERHEIAPTYSRRPSLLDFCSMLCISIYSRRAAEREAMAYATGGNS